MTTKESSWITKKIQRWPRCCQKTSCIPLGSRTPATVTWVTFGNGASACSDVIRHSL